MKKIGMIDLSIDEWHANNYPGWIRNSALAGEFELYGAWEERPNAKGKNLEQWCRDFDMKPYASQEKLVEDCDALFVLAPSNPEAHERLAQVALASGKPVFIDKPFAPDLAAARRLFARADEHRTPMWSSSALRFGEELAAVRKELAEEKIEFMQTCGGGSSFWEYSIHQFEMIVSTMGTGACRVMQCGCTNTNHAVVEFADGRRAAVTRAFEMPFSAVVTYGAGKVKSVPQLSEMFPHLLDAILAFFLSGESPVDRSETLSIAALTAAAIAAEKTPDKWVAVER